MKQGIVLGSRGFLPKRGSQPVKAVNVSYFTDSRLEKLLEEGKALKEGDFFIIDLSKLGYQKLLGTGRIAVKLKIYVSSYSKHAEEKVKSAGGVISSEEKTAPEEASV